MQNNFVITDGQKAVNILNSNDPSVWTFFSGSGQQTDANKLYAHVSAAFRAYNLKANTVGNMPFVLLKQRQKDAAGKPKAAAVDVGGDVADGDEYDNSATWQNLCGFLPNPSELFRLNTLSYISTNTIYNLRTADAYGYKVKGLYHAVATTFKPYVNAMGVNVEYIERTVGSLTERYKFPDDKRLIRMWRLDHTTELLPSPNTEALAIMNAAGEVYYADLWIKHFYERGGVAPTVIAMKGAVSPDKRTAEEGSWRDWILGLGTRFGRNPTRVVNAETLDVKQFGSSVTDLKNNDIYQRAITNIAMGTGMPLSLLMANSANYATAKEEKATWYENDIIPFCNWIAYEYNRQVFEPMGLRLEFHPETLDPQQEDETERAQAMMQYAGVLEKCATKEIFMGLAAMMGLEVPETLETALDAYYAEKDAKEKEMQEQMRQGGYTVGPDGKPLPAQTEPGKEGDKPKPFGKDEPKEADEDEDKPKKPFPPAKWIPSLDQLRELQRWQELAFRKLKRAEPLTFDWRNDTLPEEVFKRINFELLDATDESDVKAAFDVAELETEPPAPASEDAGIKTLAESINKLAESMMGKSLQVST